MYYYGSHWPRLYNKICLGPEDLYLGGERVRSMLLSADRAEVNADQSVSYDVIAAVAEREGVDPTDIEPPEYEALYDAVNPEALDSLFAPRTDGTDRTTGRVEFTFCDYYIVVTSEGDVEVYDEEP